MALSEVIIFSIMALAAFFPVSAQSIEEVKKGYHELVHQLGDNFLHHTLPLASLWFLLGLLVVVCVVMYRKYAQLLDKNRI